MMSTVYIFFWTYIFYFEFVLSNLQSVHYICMHNLHKSSFIMHIYIYIYYILNARASFSTVPCPKEKTSHVFTVFQQTCNVQWAPLTVLPQGVQWWKWPEPTWCEEPLATWNDLGFVFSEHWSKPRLFRVYMGIILPSYMDVSENRGKTPEMDGENNGKPY